MTIRSRMAFCCAHVWPLCCPRYFTTLSMVWMCPNFRNVQCTQPQLLFNDTTAYYASSLQLSFDSSSALRGGPLAGTMYYSGATPNGNYLSGWPGFIRSVKVRTITLSAFCYPLAAGVLLVGALLLPPLSLCWLQTACELLLAAFCRRVAVC
jgi:hypothetical protein